MSPHRSVAVVWMVTVMLCMASTVTPMNGQTISGTIVGTVLDQQGGILSGVGVTATNSETALSYQGVTDSTRGLYVIPEVPPGLYRVRAQFSGFQTQEHTPVRVDVNRVTEEDFTLKISASTTVVIVSSDAPMTQITTPSLGQNFDQAQIRELPILTRDINNLALLAPGAESVRNFSFASTLVPFAVNGSWGRYNNFIVDSVSNNEPVFGGASAQFTNPDIFADYAVITADPKAEFGRDSGSTINAITKGGSSKIHGTAFWFGQDNIFDAMTRADTAALLTSTPPSYEQKVGGTVGGPLGKKETFYFLSYQFDRARSDLSNVYPVIATVPTAAGFSSLQGLASTHPSVATMLSDPSVQSIPGLGGNCFPSKANPCSGPFNAIANGVQYPFGSYDVPQGNLFDLYDHQASARVDHRLNDSNDFYVRYLIDDLNTPQAVLDPAGDVAFSDLGALPDARSILRQRTQSGLIDERLARANSLNELRFSFSRIAEGIGPYNLPAALRAAPGASVGDTFGGFPGYSNYFPTAGAEYTLGQDTSTNTLHSNIFEVQENFSLTHNRHFLKMGLDFVRTQSNILDNPIDLGHYFFGNAGLFGGLQSFINEGTCTGTCADAVTQTLPDVLTSSSGVITGQGKNELPLRETDIAAFIQDDFQIRTNLDLSLGLRYERFGQPINGMLSLNPAGGESLLSTSSGNFGPRAGIAWSPGSDRKTVIRGGYALMYNQMPLNIPLLMWQSAPISPTIATVTATGLSYLGLTGVVPATGTYPNTPLSWQAVANTQVSACSGTAPGATLSSQFQPPFILQTTAGKVPLNNCSAANTVSPNLDSPYAQTWSLSVQREITPNIMAEISYVGTKGTKLYEREDLNPYQGWNTSCLTNLPANAVQFGNDQCLNERVQANRGDIAQVSNAGSSTYQGLQGALTSRAFNFHGNSLTFTASYTYSHMIDTDSEIFGPGILALVGNVKGVAANNNILTTLLSSPSGLSSIEAITPFAQTSPLLYANSVATERGNSSYDRRQRFVFSEIWGLPTRSDYNRTARAILGGWSLNGQGTLQSGQPFSPINGSPGLACADAQGEGFLATARPDIGNPSAPADTVALVNSPTCFAANPTYNIYANGVAVGSGAVSKSQAYSQAHFVQVPLGTNQGGDAGRNILTGPGIVDFDLGLFKQFRWAEGKILEFRWEVYNILNTPNYGYLLGNAFISNAQPAPAYSFGPYATPAGVTGSIPENTIDAKSAINGNYDFLSKGNMNTGNRTMQFAVHFTF